MSWESTIPYYRVINEAVKARLGGLHSAKIIIYSVDFDEVARLQQAGDWDAAGRLLGDCAQSLKAAGAEVMVIGANTMHKVAPQVEAACSLPLIHIGDVVAAELKRQRVKVAGLLGTSYTMEDPFYADYIESRHGISLLTPDADDRATIHRIIYDELCLGVISEASKAEYLRIIGALQQQGAQAIVLGCTEIGMLIGPDDVDAPVLDTAILHAQAAAEYALAG
jgi:aspartate racemase